MYFNFKYFILIIKYCKYISSFTLNDLKQYIIKYKYAFNKRKLRELELKDFIFDVRQKNSMKIRESGIELLRILAIFFVIVIHEITSFLDEGTLFVVIFRIISWPAIFCFAFITGYFLIFNYDNESKIKRFLWLTLEIIFWRVLIATLFLIITTIVEHNSVGNFFTNWFDNIILDLVSVKSWYFWAIIFIYLIFPFFAIYLNYNYKVAKKLLKWLLIFLLFISVTATLGSFLIKYIDYNFALYGDQYTFSIVLVSSVLGGYWHLIEKDKKIQYNIKIQLLGLLGLLTVYLINFSCVWWLNDQETALTYWNIFWFLSGWFYFLIFKNFNFHNKFVNWWSSLSWWIYIMHNGFYLPRGWAVRIVSTANLDDYSSTILTIFICYFLTIFLVLLTQNFDKLVVKPYLIKNLKIWWQKNIKIKQKNIK